MGESTATMLAFSVGPDAKISANIVVGGTMPAAEPVVAEPEPVVAEPEPVVAEPEAVAAQSNKSIMEKLVDSLGLTKCMTPRPSAENLVAKDQAKTETTA